MPQKFLFQLRTITIVVYQSELSIKSMNCWGKYNTNNNNDNNNSSIGITIFSCAKDQVFIFEMKI